MRRHIGPCPSLLCPVVSLWRDTDVGGDHDILKFATAEGEWGVSQPLSRNDGRLQCRVWSTANDTDDFFMHQAAKEYILGVCAESGEDGETSPRAGAFRRPRDEDGVVGERNDNRGGGEQGIAVGARHRVLTARYERQRTLRCECSPKWSCDLAVW